MGNRYDGNAFKHEVIKKQPNHLAKASAQKLAH